MLCGLSSLFGAIPYISSSTHYVCAVYPSTYVNTRAFVVWEILDLRSRIYCWDCRMKNSMRGKIKKETNAWINENETIFLQMRIEQNRTHSCYLKHYAYHQKPEALWICHQKHCDIRSTTMWGVLTALQVLFGQGIEGLVASMAAVTPIFFTGCRC